MDWFKDTDLFDELKKGNEDVLKTFFETFYPVYVSFAYGYLDDRQESEDIVQEAFVRFWESRDTFHNVYYIRAFLYKTIRHKCLNVVRHKNVKSRYLSGMRIHAEFDTTGSAFFIDSIIREETSHMIYQEVQKLSEMGRKVIAFSMDGLSNEEIAERLGISINTVKTHKVRTYQQLRIRLNELKVLLGLILG